MDNDTVVLVTRITQADPEDAVVVGRTLRGGAVRIPTCTVSGPSVILDRQPAELADQFYGVLPVAPLSVSLTVSADSLMLSSVTSMAIVAVKKYAGIVTVPLSVA